MDRAEIEKVVKATLKKYSGGGKDNCSNGLTLKLANRLISAVTAHAEGQGLSVVVAVCDSGARTVSVNSMDGAYIASYDIAVNKAYTSASLKMSTKALGELAQPGKDLYGIQFTNGGQIVIFGGGEPLYKGGQLVGAVGISGGTLSEDTALAENARLKWEEIIANE